jgi:hypothetical protein
LRAVTRRFSGDAANIRQGDAFLRQIIPVIMASDAYKNHGAIVIKPGAVPRRP